MIQKRRKSIRAIKNRAGGKLNSPSPNPSKISTSITSTVRDLNPQCHRILPCDLSFCNSVWPVSSVPAG
ncbi:hypothetical protein QQP08_027373 [Theobroma cacao]|nr:hypothetical protein QQP08_027373 [Theobroma cacao]